VRIELPEAVKWHVGLVTLVGELCIVTVKLELCQLSGMLLTLSQYSM